MRRVLLSLAALVAFVIAGCGVKLLVAVGYEHAIGAEQIQATGEAASAAAGAVRGPAQRREPP